ncbi:MAG: transcription termination factor NusA [Bacillota bacterium]
MNVEFIEALRQIEKEKGISRNILIEAVETALAAAYKREHTGPQNIKVQMDPNNGSMKVYALYTVVGEVNDPRLELSEEEAQKIMPGYKIDDVVEQELPPKDLGRIAAQNAKQIVIQRIREAERNIIYEEFISRQGDIVTGVVQRYEHKNVYLELGKAEAILPASEQMPNERYEQNLRLKTYLLEVKKASKGPQITVSRTHPGLLKRLFELEVPEIYDGTVEIKSVAREPGYRSKIGVYSRDKNVDPVGSCVGAKGSRVQSIVRELRGERIDIIPWNENPKIFIANALSPAKVSEVYIAPETRNAVVVVPDDQLSLGIGKEGQNARLAAKLTNWKIDIKSFTQAQEISDQLDEMRRLEEEATIIPEVIVTETIGVEQSWETNQVPVESGDFVPAPEEASENRGKRKKRKKDQDETIPLDDLLVKPVKKKAKKPAKFYEVDDYLHEPAYEDTNTQMEAGTTMIFSDENHEDKFGVKLGDLFKNLSGFESSGTEKEEKTKKPPTRQKKKTK